MPEPRVIDAYLDDLRTRLRGLNGADLIVAEVDDHLHEKAASFARAGADVMQAEEQAVAGFGSAECVARAHRVEAKRRRAAVPTRWTRAAGIAMLVAPPLAFVGQAINLTIRRGTIHGLGLFMLTVALFLFLFGLWGMWSRHAALGWIGRVAFWLTIASPFLAAPFSWGAAYAFGVVMLVVLVLLAVGMFRAHLVPAAPVVLLGGGAVASIVLFAAFMADDVVQLDPVYLPLLASLAGWLWLGWVLGHERAPGSVPATASA